MIALPLSAVFIVRTGPVLSAVARAGPVDAKGKAEGAALVMSFFTLACLAAAAFLYDA